MSSLRPVTVFIAAAAVLSSGCCLTRSCGSAVYGPAAIAGSCDSAGGVIACGDGIGRGGCLGLGCLGKLFGIAHHGGCTGCGDVYYHDWVSDPPRPEPCDGAGNWTGAVGAACDSCAGDCGLASGVAGEIIVDPAATCSSCGLGGGSCAHGVGSRSCFQHTGRLFYHTFTGVGAAVHGIKRGLLPACGSCNAFSFSEHCLSCSTGTCLGAAEVPLHDGVVVGNHSGIPHEITSERIKTAHGRPPHKVLSKRLR